MAQIIVIQLEVMTTSHVSFDCGRDEPYRCLYLLAASSRCCCRLGQTCAIDLRGSLTEETEEENRGDRTG